MGRSRGDINTFKVLFENYQQHMESALEHLSKEMESTEPISVEGTKRLISKIVAVDVRCAGLYDSIQEIFKDSDCKISPYIRTTEGTSTILVKPVPNLVEELKNERQKKVQEEEILQQVILGSQLETSAEEQKVLFDSIKSRSKVKM